MAHFNFLSDVTGITAFEAFKKSRVAGFNNISIDLMYGLPGESIQTWKEDINKAISLSPEHISAYHLTYEQGTPIYNMLQQHKIREVTEELSVFFNILREELLKSGYEHYEISNFCQPGKESKHNTSYWKGVNYLGCGPSAHSFNGKSREWNVSSLNDYIKGIEKGERDFETEELNADTRYNELIITSLRTSKGICLDQITQIFGGAYTDYCLKMGTKYMEQESLIIESGYLRLTEKGLFISDGIMSTLLKVEN
jgi:oxygen-independent coproporphyrinogen-3 oxidase